MTLTERYKARLSTIPHPGGNGCHPALLACANYGVLLHLDPEKIHHDIRAHVPLGSRRVPDREIRAAIHRALMDYQNGITGTTYQTPPSTVRDGKGTLERITAQARIEHEYDLWEESPIGLLEGPERDPALFLEVVFEPDDLLFIGDRLEAGILGETIRTTKQWVDFFQAGGKAGPFIIVNPLNGKPAPKADGEGETYRGNGNVTSFRHCLVEFDGLDLDTQIKFWSAVRLPVRALIYSGNKSIHGWVDVQSLAPVRTTEEWNEHIKNRLFRGLLEPVGTGPACGHPARLARLPGCWRAEKEAWQRILWLSPEGMPVC